MQTTNLHTRQLSYLQTLVQMPTDSYNIAANQRGIDYLRDFFVAHGMHIKQFSLNGHPAIVASVKPGYKTPTVMLAAHLDVVPANEYTLKQQDGKLIGRGVYDMKCAIAAYMEFIDRNQDELAHYDFAVMITTDEEIAGATGTSGVHELMEVGYIPSMCVLPDGAADWQLESGAKGYLHFTLEARGTSSHGSRPWLGDNAAYKIIDTVQELRHLYRDQNHHSATFNVGVIQGGDMPNQVPDYMRAEIDTRPTTIQEMQRLQKQIPAICKRNGVHAVLRTAIEPLEQSLDNPYLVDFANSIQKITGVKLTGYTSLGGSDARYMVAAGVPCAVFYPTGGLHHGNGEWIDETAFYHMADVIEDYVKKVARVQVSAPKIVSQSPAAR